MPPLELFAALITVISIWLTARENIWCWPTGVVSVVLYAWIFWSARLYANGALQVVYLVLIVYGWYEWLHGGANRSELRVSRTPLWGWAATILLGGAATGVAAWWMAAHTDASMPWPDAATTAFSIVAEAMTARKWIENWMLWVVIDAVTTWMLVQQKLYPSAVLYAVFVPLAVWGWWKWRKSMHIASA
jgi:nicotinamide mononucleotide transporter